MLFKFLVAETQIDEVTYVVEADSLEEARGMALIGETEEEHSHDRLSVVNRTILEVLP